MTNQYLLARIAGRDPNLRASDADRERVAERLRKSHTEGRLDMAEFQDRLERCYVAKTLGELGELVRDLPREDERDERDARAWGWGWHGRLGLAPVLIVAILLLAATGHHVFWLWIPFAFLIWRMSWWRRRHWMAAGRRGPQDWI